VAIKGDSIHIKGGKTVHGPGRRWGQYEYAQAVIGRLYPAGIPAEHQRTREFKSKLVRKVQAQLKADPAYRARNFPVIGRNTVLRALNSILDN
jgi:hypothetical protein